MSLYTEVRGNDSDSHHGDNLLYVGHNCAYTARQIKNACDRGNGRRHRHQYRCPAGCNDYIYSIPLIPPDVKKKRPDIPGKRQKRIRPERALRACNGYYLFDVRTTKKGGMKK